MCSFKLKSNIKALDCEMVGVGKKGKGSMLARISIVDYYGVCIYDKYVKPTEEVTDYRTPWSGIREDDIKDGDDFEKVQIEVRDVLANCILVGHALKCDLKVLKIDHPKEDIRDTQLYSKFQEKFSTKSPKLKDLVEWYLGERIQVGEHDSIQDAKAAMKLYIKFKNKWEDLDEVSHKEFDSDDEPISFTDTFEGDHKSFNDPTVVCSITTRRRVLRFIYHKFSGPHELPDDTFDSRYEKYDDDSYIAV